MSGENHAAAGLLQETRLFQPAKVGTDKARSDAEVNMLGC